ncbi:MULTISPECIES: hypothetical protein [Bradyrhizobium]|uniref:hypothetical protein n=1 Tax=Bradyrhizobium TaxID=374 RepID=UPI00155EE366|nr:MULTISPECIES: hypothetical protein [Bradyrhizobium]
MSHLIRVTSTTSWSLSHPLSESAADAEEVKPARSCVHNESLRLAPPAIAAAFAAWNAHCGSEGDPEAVMALCAAGLRDLSREDVLAVGQYHAPSDGDLSISRMISRVTAKPSWPTSL